MSTPLTGTQIQATYTQVLQTNSGIAGSGTVADGLGHDSLLLLGTAGAAVGNGAAINGMGLIDGRAGTAPMSIQHTFTDMASVGFTSDLVSLAILNPTGTASALHLHHFSGFQTKGSAHFSGTLYGHYNWIKHGGTGAIDVLDGYISDIEIDSSGSLGSPNNFVAYLSANSTGGVTGTHIGFFSQFQTAAASTATLQNVYGAKLNTPDIFNAGASIVNGIGLVIQDQTGPGTGAVGAITNPKNIWSQGNAINQFDGWVKEAQGPARLTAPVTNATITMSNLSDLAVNVLVGQKVFGWLSLICKDSQAAEGVAVDFNGGTATFTSASFGIAGVPAAITLPTIGVPTSTAIGTAITLSNMGVIVDLVLVVSFEAVINAAGTIIPRFAQNSHTSGTATAEIGSYFYLRYSPN